MPRTQGSYNEFIQLVVDEEEFLQAIIANCPTDHRNNPPNAIIKKLQSIPYKSLLRLAENSSLIKAWCELPVMQTFWEELWAKTAGRKPTPREAKNNSELIYRSLLPQTTINAFNLVRGTWLYDHANYIAHEHGQTDSRVQPLLEKAVQSHCFEAIRAINRIKMTKLYQTDSTISLESILQELADEIKFHGTPVLLLLALSCFEAANLYAEENVLTADHYRCAALTYMILAEKAAELSVSAIHNAYYGLGLRESNNYGWDTFAKWHDGILEQVDANYRCIFESRAKQSAEAELILSGYCTDRATSSALAISF